MFQSSSNPRAGCNVRKQGVAHVHAVVSILIQPEGRMQPSSPCCAAWLRRMFQSSSNPRAGCNSYVGFFYLFIANLHSDAAAEDMMGNFNACFQHILSMNANLQLTGTIATSSRYASSGPVKSTTLP